MQKMMSHGNANSDIIQDKNFISPNFSISKFGEYYLSSVNRKNFENIDSKSLYNSKFKESFFAENMLNIIIGLDSGLLVNYIIDNPIPDGSKFLFIELQEILNLLSIDIPDDYKKIISICNSDNFIEHLEQDCCDIYILKKKCAIYSSIAASSEHMENYTLLYNDVEKVIETKTNEHQINFSQKIFIKTQLENTSEMVNPANILKSIFPERTAIIVGGGPSMDEHISWIKRNRNNLIVLAVSRIADKLISNDIIPDFVITVDPQDISFDVNRDLMHHFDKVILIFSFHACPRIINQWQGRSMYLGNKLPWEEEDNIPTIGPTVSNSAIRIALEMGCKQILLSGVDFCYSQSGFTHVKGTLEASIGPNFGQICEWVETNEGSQAETPTPLRYAIDALQDEVALHDQVDFINLSGNAAKIKGIRYCSIENVCIKNKNNCTSDIINNLPIADNNKRNKHIGSSIIAIKKTLKSLSLILIKINRAIKLANKIKNTKNNSQKIIIYSNKINKIEIEINNKNPILIKLVKTFGFYELSKTLSSRDSTEWDQNTINTMHETYFSALKITIETLIELINETLQRLESRLLETAKNSDLSTLSIQWKKDNQPGRVLIWMNNNINKYRKFNYDEFNKINLLKDDYYAQIKNINFIYKNKIESSHGLASAFRKISHLIKSRNISGLNYMLFCLKPFKTKNQNFNRLFIYTQAKILELNNDFDQALNKVLEIPLEQCTESELKLTIKLALKNFKLDIAEKYLLEILKISSEYMPQYAYLLRIKGRLKESLEIYLDYLEEYPLDVPTWLKLGTFMIEVEQLEPAKTAFSHALIADPDNRIALEYIGRINTLLSDNAEN